MTGTNAIATTLVASFVLVAGACTSAETNSAIPSVTEVIAAVESLPPKERIGRLEKLAREEGGQLSLYTSISGSVVQDVVDAFEDETGVEVALYRASSETVEARVLEEDRADFRGADVVETGGQSMFVLAREQLLADYPFDPAPLIDDMVHEGWAATRLQQFVVGWNTKRAERPSSWEALGDPGWKGRIAIEPGDWDWYSRLWTYWVEELGVAAEEADARFERIARNAKVIEGHSLGSQLLAAGELDALVPAYSHHIDNLAKDGAPVSWLPAVSPAILRQNGVGILTGSKHPAAAALFTEWALGKGGQAAYASSGYRSPRRDAPVQDGNSRSIDEERLAEERDRWTTRWEQLLTLGQRRPG